MLSKNYYKVPLFCLIASLGLIFFAEASGAAEDSVAATVTVQNVALSVSDGTVTYGTIATSGSANTTSGGLDDSQTITNDGNVNEDFDIKGADTTAWTLAGSIGSEQYKHDYCIATCDTTPSWVALTTSYAEIAAAKAPAGTQVFDLRMNTPSATATFTEQSATVWVQASAS